LQIFTIFYPFFPSQVKKLAHLVRKTWENLRVWCENLTLLRKNLRVWCEDLLYSRLIFPAFFAELAGLPPFCAAKTPFIR